MVYKGVSPANLCSYLAVNVIWFLTRRIRSFEQNEEKRIKRYNISSQMLHIPESLWFMIKKHLFISLGSATLKSSEVVCQSRTSWRLDLLQSPLNVHLIIVECVLCCYLLDFVRLYAHSSVYIPELRDIDTYPNSPFAVCSTRIIKSECCSRDYRLL